MIRYNPKIEEGLTTEQVNYRIKNGYVNYNSDVKTKTIGQIIFYNVFTLFNILNLCLGLLVFWVGSYKNLLFLGVVICNTLISIIQEIRSKRAIDKLSIISSTKASVIRDSKNVIIDINEVVLDDIINYKRGNQVIADAIIKEGTVEVNESLLSGEANSITKKIGDSLYSGSFIVSGKCIAKVEKVGENNYASKITKEAKYVKKVNSEIMKTLKKIIKIISFIIVPLGIILFLRQYNIDKNITDAVVSSVAAIIGMIPEGLVLLTSTVLAVSVLRLSKRKVLVQQLYCIETLARVDTICLDKTGTLTEGTMEVVDVISLNDKYDYAEILSAMSRELLDDNPTMDAISRKFNKRVKYTCLETEPFSSEKKYSSVTFKEGKYILGAPDILDASDEMQELIEKYSENRLVLLKNKKDNIALILLRDKIRYKASSTLDYLRKEGVDIKIISGDNEKIITRIAKRLKFKDIRCIDMSKNHTNMNHQLVENYNIFCRVSPSQKRDLIKALKNNGHTVAMTGDGVNDVLALKEADCSIAMASGSDAARNVSELVLLNSDFDAIPKIVEEGRRTINNIERSASLFLTKTVYATLLAIIFLFVPMNYPFQPIQLSLVSSITIGIPAFILALEPNHDIIKGKFFLNVLKKSLPGGLTIVINVITVMLVATIFNLSEDIISTMAVILVAITGFILLYKICDKFNKLRIALFITLIIAFLVSIIGLPNLFELVLLKPIYIIFILLVFILDIGLFNFLSDICEKRIFKYKDKLTK
ncbi:MAG: HAD-IC family P-type ATPase [Bacilli bacterium]|nr:HAD-IC family P-type ATPase [Bacilli bacterium]